MVNISICGHEDFHCPVKWIVEEAIREIRSMYLLNRGEIKRNGEVMCLDTFIIPDGSYEFTQFQQTLGNIFNLNSLFCYL